MLNEELGDGQSTQANHYLSRIQVGTQEMADMIDSFLQLSRTTQGELAVRRVNLSEHVAHIVQKLRDRDPDRQVEMVLENDVYSDVIKRIFSLFLNNRLYNTCKYTSSIDSVLTTNFTHTKN